MARRARNSQLAEIAAIHAAYERSDLLAQMAKQTLDANADIPGTADVVVTVTARAMQEDAAAPAADAVVCGAACKQQR